MLLYDVTKVLDGDTGLDMGNCFLQTLSRRFDQSHIVRICLGFVANIVGLVQVPMIALMEERNIDVEDIAVLQNSLVWNTVAYYLVDGKAY